jgi:hypothetical protein
MPVFEPVSAEVLTQEESRAPKSAADLENAYWQPRERSVKVDVVREIKWAWKNAVESTKNTTRGTQRNK